MSSRSARNWLWSLGFSLSLATAIFYAYQLSHFLNGEPAKRRFHDPIQIAIIDWAGYYPIAVAKELGLFKQYGLDVDVRLAPNLIEMNDWIRTGKVQAATGVLADFYLLRDLGAPIQMIVATDYSLGDTLLAGKHIRTAHDLIGKRIGIAEMNSWAEYFIFELLRTAGVDPEKVQFRTFAPDQIPKAIQDGEIDAGHTWDPVLSAGIKSGLRPLLSSKIRPQLVISGLAVREEILGLTDDGYSVDVGLVQAIFEAQKIATDDPVRFARIVQRFLFTNNVEWSESSIIESMTRNTELCDLKRNTEGFAENGVFRVETTNISNFFEARGVTSTKVAAIDLLNDNAIRRIEDETTLHAGKSTPQAGKTVPN